MIGDEVIRNIIFRTLRQILKEGCRMIRLPHIPLYSDCSWTADPLQKGAHHHFYKFYYTAVH